MSTHEVFISYSHEDNHWRKDLERFLCVFERGDYFRSWSDEKLKPGDAGRDGVQWSIPLNDATPVSARTLPQKRHSGVVNVGPKRNWLYSRELFVEPDDLLKHVNELVDHGHRG